MKLRRFSASLVAAALLAAFPAGAGADEEDPNITTDPAIHGTARVAETLRETAAEWSPGDAVATFTWHRCADQRRRSCDEGDPVGQGRDYVVGETLVGQRLRVRVTVEDEEGETDVEWSGPTDVVAAAPPPPPPPPPPPVVTPPVVAPVVVPPATVDPPAGDVRGSRAQSRVRRLRPFPVIRIRGRLTRSGAQVTLFTVRGPRGARIAVHCRGRGCPVRRWARTSRRLVHLRPLERHLRAGVRIRITVRRKSRIGKHTVIVIRRGKPPLRRDRCLAPGSRSPSRCANV